MFDSGALGFGAGCGVGGGGGGGGVGEMGLGEGVDRGGTGRKWGRGLLGGLRTWDTCVGGMRRDWLRW